MTAIRMAALQMVSGPELAPNLDAAGRLIRAAAAAGAKLVALPENFYCIGRTERDKVALRERDGKGPIQEFLKETSKRLGIWIVGGTTPISIPDETRIRSACLVYDDAGQRVARYDKSHLFRFTSEKESHDESRTLERGDGPVAVESPFGRLGLSICYDVRFPEHYRALGGVEVIFVPSAFTVPTGEAHWHILLRARAIENYAYVVAPAQGGTHASGRRTYGHTMVVGPWGEILAERPEGEGVVLADIDVQRIHDMKRRLG